MKFVTKCKKCGKETSVDTSMVLTTYPAQYGYTCEHCGERSLCFTYEVNIINETTYGLQGVRIPDSLHDYVSEQIKAENTVYNLDSVISDAYIQIGGKQFKTKDFMEALKKLMEENENELEKKLAKYKSAFEILKEKGVCVRNDRLYFDYEIYIKSTKEERELLEELLKDD